MALTHWLEQTYRNHRTQLFRVAWQILRSQAKAEDAVHGAFERSLRLRNRPEDDKAYMLVAVRNAALDVKRRELKHLTSDIQLNEPCDWPTPVEGFEEQLESLPQVKQEVIELHLRVGLSFVEISALLNEPVSTVTSRYRRAISELRILHGVNHDER